MNQRTYVAYRVAWSGIASVVVTVVLFLIAVSIGDITQGQRAQAVLPDVAQGFWSPGDPVYVQYLDWVYSLVTFRWGESLRYGEPVAGLLADRAIVTAAYLVPAIGLGTLAATMLGYMAAAREQSALDGIVRTTSYVVVAIPNFVLAVALERYVRDRWVYTQSFDPDASLVADWNLVWLTAAAVIVGTHVAAVQLRQVRAQSSRFLAAEFTRMLRAKGAGRLRTARHVLRAAAVPLTSLFVAETLGLLFVSVFVIEAALGVQGLGYVAWEAAAVNDVPVVLTLTFLVSMTIILAGLLEDLAAVAFDPRLGD